MEDKGNKDVCVNCGSPDVVGNSKLCQKHLDIIVYHATKAQKHAEILDKFPPRNGEEAFLQDKMDELYRVLMGVVERTVKESKEGPNGRRRRKEK